PVQLQEATSDPVQPVRSDRNARRDKNRLTTRGAQRRREQTRFRKRRCAPTAPARGNRRQSVTRLPLFLIRDYRLSAQGGAPGRGGVEACLLGLAQLVDRDSLCARGGNGRARVNKPFRID